MKCIGDKCIAFYYTDDMMICRITHELIEDECVGLKNREKLQQMQENLICKISYLTDKLAKLQSLEQIVKENQ